MFLIVRFLLNVCDICSKSIFVSIGPLEGPCIVVLKQLDRFSESDELICADLRAFVPLGLSRRIALTAFRVVNATWQNPSAPVPATLELRSGGPCILTTRNDPEPKVERKGT